MRERRLADWIVQPLPSRPRAGTAAPPTGDNGNFYTTTAVQMPLTVRSSKCPSNSAMTAKVSAGSCNSCHDSTNPVIL